MRHEPHPPSKSCCLRPCEWLLRQVLGTTSASRLTRSSVTVTCPCPIDAKTGSLPMHTRKMPMYSHNLCFPDKRDKTAKLCMSHGLIATRVPQRRLEPCCMLHRRNRGSFGLPGDRRCNCYLASTSQISFRLGQSTSLTIFQPCDPNNFAQISTLHYAP
ncbi:hypothetical protein V8C37DRAFT_132644 [Trichoderma ceciliae]